MSNVWPPLETILSQNNSSCLIRSEEERLHGTNTWPEEHVEALIMGPPVSLFSLLSPSLLNLDLSYCITIQDEDLVQILKLVSGPLFFLILFHLIAHLY